MRSTAGWSTTGVSPTIAALPGMTERTIICDGFSKTYAMTGWRLGYGIMPPALAERVDLLMTHSVGCTASFTQSAGVEALTGPQARVRRWWRSTSAAATCWLPGSTPSRACAAASRRARSTFSRTSPASAGLRLAGGLPAGRGRRRGAARHLLRPQRRRVPPSGLRQLDGQYRVGPGADAGRGWPDLADGR